MITQQIACISLNFLVQYILCLKTAMFFRWNNALDGLKTHLEHTAEYREARDQPQGHLKLLNTQGKGTRSHCVSMLSVFGLG